MRLAIVLFALLAAPAAATTWSCRLTPAATQIACTAVAEPVPAADTTGDTTAVVKGVRFPLDPGRTWYIDLWSPATDMDGVQHLARASMCYRSPGCKVLWQARPEGGAPYQVGSENW